MEEALGVLVENLNDWKEKIEHITETEIKAIKKAKTLEEVMSEKQNLLKKLIKNLPLNSDECIFCIMVDDADCPKCLTKCQYAKYHEICRSPVSDYQKIKNAQEELLDKLSLYYKDEKYNGKLNNKEKTALIYNLEKWKDEFITDIENKINEIKNSQTFEEIMKRKQELLEITVKHLPLSSWLCIFCLKTDIDCKNCEYAEIHGNCYDGISDFGIIVKAKVNLIETITIYYYRGEKYENE